MAIVASAGALAVAGVVAASVCKRNKKKSSSCCGAATTTTTAATVVPPTGAAASIPAELLAVVQEWMSYDPDTKSLAEVKRLYESGNVGELTKLFLPRISFGTAGLRSRMAPGYANMNELVIIQTSQGLARYMLAQNPQATTQGIVIGYDGRHNSRKFAEITAAVFLSVDIPVYLFDRLTCTPLVPYGVLQLKTGGGVMVTASHNPKDDNGYKVYWSNGAQIIPPHDIGIAAAILANRQPWRKYTFDPNHPKLKNPSTTLIERYMSTIPQYSYHLSENSEAKLRVTYTAMHGVGAAYVEKAFAAFNLPAYIPTKEQVAPDPDFPTVAFPNPEEGKGALQLAMNTADREGSPLILANDPDADRLAVAERDAKETTKWNILSGNEIALLFADWVWGNYIRTHANVDKSKCVMLASTVSSQVVGAMARKEGFTFIPTLTGFKWMGNVAADVEREGKTFLFAYEVEIGFLVGNMSLDKDGVRTAAIFYEMANQWYKRGITLKDRLDQLYKKYGYYTMTPSYFFCYDPAKIAAIFKRLRTMNNGSYPNMCGEFKIASVRDATLGLDSGESDGKSRLPATPDSQMITFRFENGTTTTLRTSGTEPKLKYYVECCDNDSVEKSRALTDKMTDTIIANFLQPEVNGLVAPKRA